MVKAIFLILIFINFLNANTLQNAINKAKPYSILKLPNGIYKGNIIINKPLTIIAKDNLAIIQGENKNTVIQISSSNVTLKNLTIKASGKRLENKDAAIKVFKAQNILIDSCTIEDTLYGIDLDMVENSKVINNTISSKNLDISLRGDAIKLFYSNNNLVKNNFVSKSRDITLLYSNDNRISQNHIEKSRFALYFENSHKNIIKENHFEFNSTGLIFAGAKDTKVTKNIIKSSIGSAGGIGVLIKGVSNFIFKENIVNFNNKAFYIDAKHNEEDIKRFITNNEIKYNKEAFHFHGAIKRNLIKNNAIIGNIDDVVKSVRGNITSKNIVENNYWSQYNGFDMNKDNIGDTTYKIFQYADRLWHYNNKVKFFYGTPIISILNFILKLAPFIEPVLLLEDTKPTIKLQK